MLKALWDTIRYGYWILKLYLVQLMDVLNIIWSKTRLQICKRPWSSLILSSREGRTFPQKFISIFSHVVLHQRFYLFFNFSRKPSFLITFFSCTSFLVFFCCLLQQSTRPKPPPRQPIESKNIFFSIISCRRSRCICCVCLPIIIIYITHHNVLCVRCKSFRKISFLITNLLYSTHLARPCFN